MRGQSARMGDVPAGFREFVDRRRAAGRLADRLESYRGHDVLVLGIPRGGVAVAAEISRSLGAELDVVVARKIGAPLQPELALGAVTADGARFTNLALIRDLNLSAWLLRLLADEQRAEARRSEPRLRGGVHGPASLAVR